jgi:hypothetical protein
MCARWWDLVSILEQTISAAVVREHSDPAGIMHLQNAAARISRPLGLTFDGRMLGLPNLPDRRLEHSRTAVRHDRWPPVFLQMLLNDAGNAPGILGLVIVRHHDRTSLVDDQQPATRLSVKSSLGP